MLSGRFFAVLIASDIESRTGLVAVVVSATSDPQGDWMVYHFTKTEYFPDFPKMGISGDKVVVTANGFDIDNPCAPSCNHLSEYWVMDKNQLTAFVPSAASNYFTHQCGTSFCYHTIMPAVSLSATNTLYMGALDIAFESTMLTVFTITGTPSSGNVTVVTTTLPIPVIGPPRDAEQLDVNGPGQPPNPPLIATNIHDIIDAIWREGHLWLTGSKNCSGSWAGGTAAGSCIYIFDVLTGPMTLNRNITIEALRGAKCAPRRTQRRGNLAARRWPASR